MDIEAEHRMVFLQKHLISGQIDNVRSAYVVTLNNSAFRSVIFGV